MLLYRWSLGGITAFIAPWHFLTSKATAERSERDSGSLPERAPGDPWAAPPAPVRALCQPPARCSPKLRHHRPLLTAVATPPLAPSPSHALFCSPPLPLSLLLFTFVSIKFASYSRKCLAFNKRLSAYMQCLWSHEWTKLVWKGWDCTIITKIIALIYWAFTMCSAVSYYIYINLYPNPMS